MPCVGYWSINITYSALRPGHRIILSVKYFFDLLLKSYKYVRYSSHYGNVLYSPACCSQLLISLSTKYNRIQSIRSNKGHINLPPQTKQVVLDPTKTTSSKRTWCSSFGLIIITRGSKLFSKITRASEKRPWWRKRRNSGQDYCPIMNLRLTAWFNVKVRVSIWKVVVRLKVRGRVRVSMM